MKKLLPLVVVALALMLCQPANSQDTTIVQTLTFNDITKRRDVFKFPDDSKTYRRILMRYNLKCDPRTTQDQYDCGEWDYLSYTYVYGHDGKLDSTFVTGPSFRVNNTAPSSYSFRNNPIYDIWRETQYTINHTSTSSLQSYTVGSGSVTLANVFDLSKNSGRSQFIWTASELQGAGMSAGNITGIQLDVSKLGSDVENLTIKLGHTSLSDLSAGQFVSGLTQVYRHKTAFGSTGMVDIQFPNSFSWDGSSNLIIEFSYDGKTGTSTELQGSNQSYDAGITSSGSGSCLEFAGSQNWVNLGPEPVITGAGARTIELWAKIDRFNNAGLFQAGTSGTGKDFSLRTTTTDDAFRAQLWGAGFDFNFNAPGAKGAWHHYAMTYDGTTARVYFDGQLVASNTVSLITAATDFRLGRWQGSYLFGKIDEVRVWDKALSQTDIESWMNKSVDNGHPSYANLIGYYQLNEGMGLTVSDASPKNNQDGVLSGIPWWRTVNADELFFNPSTSTTRPNVVLESGVYTSNLDSTYVNDTIPRKPSNLVKYNNPANGVQIPENDPNHPSLPTESKTVWEGDLTYLINKNTGDTISFMNNTTDSTITNSTKEWYSPEYRIEIARFITPYGIGLDLGPDGFVWWYDVTDYVHYLRDSVDIRAGDQLELIDLQFWFIEGTPARDVISVNRVWGQSASRRYSELDNDTKLSEVEVPLDPKTKHMKVRTRITGHGHNSSDGNYPHCCEWRDNTHSLIVDGLKYSDWHIWQTNDCAENPVYPQGGTWLGSREGWCPGDVVKNNDFEIGFLLNGSSVKLDYDISDVPTNNQGMGNGNYHIAVHGIQYGEANFQNDVEILDVYMPTSEGIHSRKGSVCDFPKVVIRNGGEQKLKSCEIRYRVGDGDIRSLNWTGSLNYMETEEVELPVADEGFYSGNGKVGFEVLAANPNGVGDENRDNSRIVAQYEVPDNYNNKIAIRLRTNNFASQNWYIVKNIQGDTVAFKDNFAASTTYTDTLDLPEGCYSFYMHDDGNDGLYYYFNRNTQGSGSCQFWIFNQAGQLNSVKTLEADFGRHTNYSFTTKKELGNYDVDNPSDLTWSDWELWPNDIEEVDADITMAVYPNPSKGEVNVELFGISGVYVMGLYSSLGEKIKEIRIYGEEYYKTQLDLAESSDGIYFLRIESANGVQVKRIVLEK